MITDEVFCSKCKFYVQNALKDERLRMAYPNMGIQSEGLSGVSRCVIWNSVEKHKSWLAPATSVLVASIAIPHIKNMRNNCEDFHEPEF